MSDHQFQNFHQPEPSEEKKILSALPSRFILGTAVPIKPIFFSYVIIIHFYLCLHEINQAHHIIGGCDVKHLYKVKHSRKASIHERKNKYIAKQVSGGNKQK